MPRNGGGRFHRTNPNPETFGGPDRNQGNVSVEVGRGGQHVEVAVGDDFVNTIEGIARDYNYGGYYRVFVNGSELADPDAAPDKFEAGMRVSITSYDKVGTTGWKV